MKIIANVIAGIASILTVSVVVLNFTIPLATVLSFAGFLFIVNSIFAHVKDKKLPKILDWVRYIAILLATILLTATLYYHSIVSLILAIIMYVTFFVTSYFAITSTKN